MTISLAATGGIGKTTVAHSVGQKLEDFAGAVGEFAYRSRSG
jgi:hypothetical protein